MLDLQASVTLAISVSAIGGAWLTVRKIAKDGANSRKEYAADILQAAKEEDSLVKAKLESRIESIRAELKSLELSVNKDLDHLKETHTYEIRNLAQKLEDLRSELRNQHGQLVQLLGEMIKKRD